MIRPEMMTIEDDEAILLPTRTCFEDVTLEFISIVSKNRHRYNDTSMAMVHGICLLEDGRPYSHAWIEMDGKAIFSGILRGVKGFAELPVAEFDRIYQVQERTRYSASQAYNTAIRNSDAPPPWERKYLELCNDWPGRAGI